AQAPLARMSLLARLRTRLPLPGGEGVWGGGARPWPSVGAGVVHPHPTLPLKGEGFSLRALAGAALLALAACTQGGDAPEVDTSVIGAGENWDNPGGDWA